MLIDDDMIFNRLKKAVENSQKSDKATQTQDNSQNQTEHSAQPEATPEPEAHSIELERIHQEDQALAKRRKDNLEEAERKTFTEPIEEEKEENIVYGGKSFMDVATPEQKQNCRTLVFLIESHEQFDGFKDSIKPLDQLNRYIIGESNGIQKRIQLDTTKLKMWWGRRTGSAPLVFVAACASPNMQWTNQLRWIQHPTQRKLDDFFEVPKVSVDAFQYYAKGENIQIVFHTDETLSSCFVKIFSQGKLKETKPAQISNKEILFKIENLEPREYTLFFNLRDNQKNLIPTESKRIEIIQPSIVIENQNTPYIGQDIKVNLQMSNETIEWLKERTDKIRIDFSSDTLLKQEDIKPDNIQVSIPSDEFTSGGQKNINLNLYDPNGKETLFSESFSVNLQKPWFRIEKVNGKDLDVSKIERASDGKYDFEIQFPVDLSEYKFFIIYGTSSNPIKKQLTEKHGKWHVEIPSNIRNFLFLLVINNRQRDQKAFHIVEPPEQPDEPTPEPETPPEPNPASDTARLPVATNPGEDTPEVMQEIQPELLITYPDPTPHLEPHKIIFYEGTTDPNNQKALTYEGRENLQGNQLQILNRTGIVSQPRIDKIYLIVDQTGHGMAIGPKSRMDACTKPGYFVCNVNDIIIMIESDGRVSYKLEGHSTARYLGNDINFDVDSRNGLYIKIGTLDRVIPFFQKKLRLIEDTMKETYPIIQQQKEAIQLEDNIDELLVQEIEEQKSLGQFLTWLQNQLRNTAQSQGIFYKQKVIDQIKDSLEKFMKEKEGNMRKLFKEIEKLEQQYIKVSEKELKTLSNKHMEELLNTTGNEKATTEWNTISIKDHHKQLIKECNEIIKNIKEQYKELKEEEFRLLDDLASLYNHFVKKEELEKKITKLGEEVANLIKLDWSIMRTMGTIEQKEMQRVSKLEELTRALPALHKAFIQSNHTRAKDYIQKEVQF
ncbi:MAG: hypothetical protein R6V53_06945 [Candidatus Woesearchaeota archaeon]